MRTKSLVLLSLFPVLAVGTAGRGANPFQQDSGPDGLVAMEAENFDKNTPQGGHTWTLVTAPTGFTGPGAMQALPNNGTNNNANYLTNSPRLDYEINFVKTGTVYVWVRAYGPSGDDDSLHSGLDNQAIATADRISNFGTAYTWTNTAYQDPERIMFDVPTLGKHTFNLWMREDGAIVDKIVLTTNPNYKPTGNGPAESSRGLPVLASNPAPEPGATDVLRDVIPAWQASAFARTHDVYWGQVFADVNNASRANPGTCLVSQGQTATTYTPAAPLAYGQTYYWRVDEVNAPPDNTIFKGDVWSFTVEPYSYPIPGKSITATASSVQNSMGPENTINGSGLTGDLHGTDGTTMWMSTGAAPNWIQYQFDKVYKLYDLKVWNSNQTLESFVGFGAKDVTIEYSTDGATWTALANVPPFARAPGTVGYAANTTVSFGGVRAQYVKLTITSNWGGVSPVVSLSEVRFSYVPTQARVPQPAAGATGQALTTTLSWRPGREAGTHQVFFGTDPNAVAQGTVAAQTVTAHSFDPGPLNFGTTYYWKVDEVNTATSYPGDVWSFTTQEYVVIDDFEAYDQDQNRLYDSWIDGSTDGKSNSYVGYNPTAAQLAAGAAFAETKIVHGGKQSMPVDYNNVKAPYVSEATRTFATAQDWTTNGADTLSLWFQGRAPAFLDKGDGTYRMGGSGTDIWNSADQFRFAYRSLSGNGTLVAQVLSVVNSGADAWGKAGVMIRESLAPGSRFAAVYATPGNGVRYQARLTTDAAAVSDSSVATAEQKGLTAPVWVKIERSGSTFNGYYSLDGVKWTALSWNPQTLNMTAATVYLGLAVTGHGATQMTTAQFSSVATTGNVTGAWQVQAIGATQPSNDPGPLYVTVQDKAGKSQTVVNPDPAASIATGWTEWRVPLSSLTGVNLAAVKQLVLGVGDQSGPKAGGAGRMFFDDIRYGHPVK